MRQDFLIFSLVLHTGENIEKNSLTCEINSIFNIKPLNILYKYYYLLD